MADIRDTRLLRRFGSHLRELRLSQNLTIEQLANKADIEISQIYRIESGKINTTISTLNALAAALKL
ncbi:MAG: helix-turn-helix transcriptional regulator [Chitinophagales bacterium]|nr:helix-turn-helix transcriptional regulator [Chitinophagales bacterium]